MRMYWGKVFAALMLVLSLCACRQAAAATYTLECNANKQGKITAQLSSFQFEISAPTDLQTGQRTGVSHYKLFVHMPVQRAYINFLQAIDTNEAIHTCKLTETESGGVVRVGSGAGKSVDSLEWTLQDVSLSNATATGSDGSGTNGGVPQGGLLVTMIFKSFILAARP